MLTYDQMRRNEQRQALDMLRTYNPWGKPGGGAPHNPSSRRHNLLLDEIYPEKKLIRSQFPEKTSLEKRRSRGRSGGRIRGRDPQLWFHPGARATVENLLRWRLPRQDQINYRKCLDEIVNYKKRLEDEVAKKNLEFERKMLVSHGPWGGRGPGGRPWRHPGDIGRNFSHSMGWTTESTFNFPDIIEKTSKKHTQFEKSPDLHQYEQNPHQLVRLSPNEHKNNYSGQKNYKGHRKSPPDSNRMPCIIKSKHTTARNSIEREMPADFVKQHEMSRENPYIRDYSEFFAPKDAEKQGTKDSEQFNREALKAEGECGCKNERRPEDGKKRTLLECFPSSCGGERTGGTPTRQLMRLTGGVELVPLMRGRGRPPRPPGSPRWRPCDAEYLRELTSQSKAQQRRKEEPHWAELKDCGLHTCAWREQWDRGPDVDRHCIRKHNLTKILAT